jgi:3-oxoacyl-[acyl-carrier protein] reductase
MSALAGKAALVTGASLGIGAAIARRLAAEGAAVVVNYARSQAPAEALVKEIEAAGGRAVAVKADLRNAADLARLVQTTVDVFGRLDVLVNNAGVYEFSPIDSVTEEHIDQQFSLNVKSLLLATREAVKHFGDNGGSVINISSVVATGAVPNGSVYSATKAAVDSITRTLAAELGPRGILVNSVSPGPTVTEGFQTMDSTGDIGRTYAAQTPLRRLGTPEDIANVVAFLASPDAGWITGQVLTASGGMRV